MENVIDRKFEFTAVNPANNHHYSEKNALILCAHDRAVPHALKAYRNRCTELGANPEHLISIDLMIQRIEEFQAKVGSKVPDTIGEEITRCIGPKEVSDSLIQQEYDIRVGAKLK